MKKLKSFIFNVNIEDGDLSLCKNIDYAFSQKNRKHYNYKDDDLPKKSSSDFGRNNEIDEWRKVY